jgi:hypothetical protein
MARRGGDLARAGGWDAEPVVVRSDSVKVQPPNSPRKMDADV